MALHIHVTREQEGQLDGKPFVWLKPTGELEEERCDRCGGEAFPHLCFAEWREGKRHHHGRVHDLKDGNWRLVALCDDCHSDYAHECIERKDARLSRQGVRE